MKQFHPTLNPKYPDGKELLAHYNNPQQYPGQPVLWAWMVESFKSSDSATFVRNPYYWKVDPEGNQLPYIDKIDVKIAPTGTNWTELLLLKTLAGEIDFQIRDYPIKNVSVLKENEKKGDYRTMMWNRGDFAWPWIILVLRLPRQGHRRSDVRPEVPPGALLLHQPQPHQRSGQPGPGQTTTGRWPAPRAPSSSPAKARSFTSSGRRPTPMTMPRRRRRCWTRPA